MVVELVQLVVAVAAILVAAGILLLFGSYFRLWLQAFMSGAHISLLDLIGMTFRKVNRKVIVQAKIMAVQAGLTIDDDAMSFKDTAISTKMLEAHYLAGGDVTKVIMAMIAAKRGNVELDFREASTIDLSGRDVLEEAHRRVSSHKPLP